MQQNVSQSERAASIALGSLALARAYFSKKGKISRLTQTASGAGLLWRGLSGHCPLYDRLGKTSLPRPEKMEKSLLINRNLDEVREILGEGDPVWRTSDSSVFPMTAGDQLWDLRLTEYGDGRRTMIHAVLSGSEPAHVTGVLKSKLVKQALDSELRKLKALLETGEYPTIEGQSHGRRSKLGKAVENITERVQEKIHEQIPVLSQPAMEASL